MRSSHMKTFSRLFLALPILLLGGLTASAYAQDSAVKVSMTAPASYSFTKKRYSIRGTAQIIQTDTGSELVFDEDFKTKGGPDLKIYLSKKSLSELGNENVNTNSVKISVLRSNKGAQSYIIPESLNLSDYKSVLIHCEAFTVLWGGFDL